MRYSAFAWENAIWRLYPSAFPDVRGKGIRRAGRFFSERSSRSLLARKNRNCVPLPAEFGVVHPDFVVPEQGNSSNIYSILDLKISLGYNSYNAKYQDLYSSPANIVWLREC
jgi:hypothetical protein